jgi:aminoglycoside phosphotransferase (APT) family kinase protein
MSMHDDEVITTTEQVRRLVGQQFPRWANLPVQPLPVGGTDHSLYRLGDSMLIRMPRIAWAVDQVAKDERWLPELAPRLPFQVPVPLSVGAPGEGYPWPWLVAPWLPGANPEDGAWDTEQGARDLARFVRALGAIDGRDGPAAEATDRGAPLRLRDDVTRQAIKECGDRIDAAGVTAVWEDALAALEWLGPPTWVHGDLSAGNLLVQEGRLSAVIDFGGLGVGDPSVDLMPAWSLFDAATRPMFRAEVGCDDATWRRGRGWAVSTAVIAIPYYWDTFPALVQESLRKLAEALADEDQPWGQGLRPER